MSFIPSSSHTCGMFCTNEKRERCKQPVPQFCSFSFTGAAPRGLLLLTLLLILPLAFPSVTRVQENETHQKKKTPSYATGANSPQCSRTAPALPPAVRSVQRAPPGGIADSGGEPRGENRRVCKLPSATKQSRH